MFTGTFLCINIFELILLSYNHPPPPQLYFLYFSDNIIYVFLQAVSDPIWKKAG